MVQVGQSKGFSVDGGDIEPAMDCDNFDCCLAFASFGGMPTAVSNCDLFLRRFQPLAVDRALDKSQGSQGKIAGKPTVGDALQPFVRNQETPSAV